MSQNQVLQIKYSLRDLAKTNASFLETIYQKNMQMFLSDNNRIWIMGSIMVPLALSGFALLPTLKGNQVYIPAIISTLILIVWNVFADRHRKFQDTSMVWMRAIEELMIEQSGGLYPYFEKPNRWLSVRLWRWGFAVLVSLVWVFALVIPAAK